MDLIEVLRMSVENLRSVKVRTALTALGIIIGVSAVIANVAIGTGFQVYLNEQMTEMGTNFVIVSEKISGILDDEELRWIERLPEVESATPLKYTGAKMTYLSESVTVSVAGVTSDYLDVAKVKMLEGNFINERSRYSVVLGYDVAHEYFRKEISAGSSVKIAITLPDGRTVERDFRVMGIIEKKATIAGGVFNPNDLVIIPVSTLNEILGEEDYSSIMISARSMELVGDVKEKIDRHLAQKTGVPRTDIGDERKKPYSIITQEEILERVNQMIGTFSTVLISIAAVSLLVGSIGIMNIMLVSVTERTREIGVLKAIGATKTNILLIFLSESSLLSLFGGSLGIVFGIALSRLFSRWIEVTPVISYRWILLGMGISVAVGILAGLYPAYKAAQMDPVEALRYE
ncbi:MAG: putative transport system permease protein [Archaeoglobi archaeon]|nr:putative transport system permease protein [Archaeoglobi archaeon]